MPHTVLITDPLAPEGIERLKSHPTIEFEVHDGLSEEELVEQIRSYDGLIIRSGTKVNKYMIKEPDKLQVIGQVGTMLGEANINIGGYLLSRDMNDGEAFAVVSHRHVDPTLEADATTQVQRFWQSLRYPFHHISNLFYNNCIINIRVCKSQGKKFFTLVLAG